MSFEELQPEDEILSLEDEKARRLLSSLKRIDAPKDFDFRLKARIANTKRSDFQPRLFPILRYVAPLGLAIIVLAVLVFNGLYSFDNQTVPTVVENFSQKPDERGNVIVNSPLLEQAVAANSNTRKTNTENSDKKEDGTFQKDSELAVNSKKSKNENPINENKGGGSRDAALSNTKLISPPGLNPNRKIDKPKDFDNPTQFLVKDILSQLGIEAVYSDNKWKVVSVKKDSLAERSEVKPNDIVEAIDENSISTETILTKAINGKNLYVIRDGKRLEIKLQNR